MIELKGISLKFENRSIFNNLSFSLRPSSVYGILGPSGAGKTSLIKIIAGHLDPTRGEVALNGKRLPRSSQLLIPGFNEIVLVSSTYDLDWNHTCLENIRESILGWPKLQREKRVKELLKGLSLEKVSGNLAKHLSEGEKQRIAIARAIAKNPQWLLLDEPLGHLDLIQKQKLLNQLFNLGVLNVLMVSHDVQELMGICQYLAVLNANGKLSKFESPQKLYFELTELNSAQLMGPVNVLFWNERIRRFRPTSFVLSKEGIELSLLRLWFNGMVYVHQFISPKNEEVILYHSSALPLSVTIIPIEHESV